MAINQTISTIPQAGHRGIDIRDTFVTKQEAFQDALTDVFVTEINAFKTQANALETNVNTKEATVVAKEALMSPHYSAIDAINSNMSNVNTVANNIADIQNAEENATLAINAKNDALTYKTDAETAYANTVQTANVSKWISGTSYVEGSNVWSPINFKTYRAKANTSGTTDPSLDSTNWAVMASVLGINSETIGISSNYQITKDNEIAISFTPSSNLIVTLPNATTISDSVVKYLYNNSSTYYIQVNDFGGAYKFTLSPKLQAIVTCVDTSTSSGVWVEQNKVMFNPVYKLPATDISSAYDQNSYTDVTTIVKNTPSTSDYYTLYYKNTSQYPVLQSVNIASNDSITLGSTLTVFANSGYTPCGAVALNTSTNTGILLYYNTVSGTNVRTFTNSNGTLAQGTAYSLADRKPSVQASDNSQGAPNSRLCRISNTEIAFSVINTANNYNYVHIFSTSTNTFSSGLLGHTGAISVCKGINDGILYAFVLNSTSGQGLIFKYSISGTTATEIGTVRDIYGIGSTAMRYGAFIKEISDNRLAVCYYDHNTRNSTFMIVDTSVTSYGTINDSVLKLDIKYVSNIIKISTDKLHISGVDYNGKPKSIIISFDGNYLCSIIGTSLVSGVWVDNLPCLSSELANNSALTSSGTVLSTYSDGNASYQHRLVAIQTK